MPDTYDYIIVGAGSAGCVLASRLSEDPRRTVLVVESGPSDNNMLIRMPRGMGKLMRPGSPYYWEFTASQGGNRREEPWIKGRAVGGSSSVNGMVYIRGAPADYDGWQAMGCPGWGWNEMGRCFVALEDHQLGAKEWRGVGGPLKITMEPHDPLGDAVVAAAAQSGIPTVDDFNDIPAVSGGGFGRQPRTVWRGRRFSAADAFLKPAQRRPNVEVVTDTDVLGIAFDDQRRATGVRIGRGGSSRTVSARAEILLCAGAINSPKLLQLSGIGSPALLQSLGIEVLVEAPEVGRNLQEHRTISVVHKLTRGGINLAVQGTGLWASLARYWLSGTGALSGATFNVGGFLKTKPGLDRPDGQIGVGLFSFGETGLNQYPGMTMYGFMLRPESRGELHIRSTDPLAPPFIDANYLATELDRESTIGLIRYIRRIAEQPALAPFIDQELLPGEAVTSDEDILESTFQYGTPGFHISGTCRMGSDETAVLDPHLRVKGVSGLRVVDTSIMPTLVSGNTNGPAMAIAWRASELIRGD